MAKKGYSRKKKSQLLSFMVVVLLLAAGVFIWRGWFYKPKTLISKTDLDRAMMAPVAPARADVTAPTDTGGAGAKPDGAKMPTSTPDSRAVPGPAAASSSPGGPEKSSAPDSERAAKLFQQGQTAWQAKNYLAARDALSEAIQIGLPLPQDQQARQMLNETADHWLFSRDLFAGDEFCRQYQVAPGDMLVNLQKKFAVPYQLLMRINNIEKPGNLTAGQTIKTVQGPFHVVIRQSRYLMSVYLGDVLVRSYPVGLGQPGRQTPTGLWRVRLKQENPAWYDAQEGKNYLPNDPDNPLGEHWIALEGLEGTAKDRTGFGIHGTIKPEEIGHDASRGCIRLYNGDVRELFDMLIEGQSLVRVVE